MAETPEEAAELADQFADSKTDYDALAQRILDNSLDCGARWTGCSRQCCN